MAYLSNPLALRASSGASPKYETAWENEMDMLSTLPAPNTPPGEETAVRRDLPPNTSKAPSPCPGRPGAPGSGRVRSAAIRRG